MINLARNNVLLDTNVCTYFFIHDDNARYFETHLIGKEPVISFITKAELLHGAYKKKWSAERTESLERFIVYYTLLPFDSELCRVWARTLVKCEDAGIPIDTADCWIAACALDYDCALATNDQNFKRVREKAVKELELIIPP